MPGFLHEHIIDTYKYKDWQELQISTKFFRTKVKKYLHSAGFRIQFALKVKQFATFDFPTNKCNKKKFLSKSVI